MLRILSEFAMGCGVVPTQRNPMELVTIRAHPNETAKPRSLTVDEFQRFIVHLAEPFHTIALVYVCFDFALARHWPSSGATWIGSTGNSA